MDLDSSTPPFHTERGFLRLLTFQKLDIMCFVMLLEKSFVLICAFQSTREEGICRLSQVSSENASGRYPQKIAGSSSFVFARAAVGILFRIPHKSSKHYWSTMSSSWRDWLVAYASARFCIGSHSKPWSPMNRWTSCAQHHDERCKHLELAVCPFPVAMSI